MSELCGNCRFWARDEGQDSEEEFGRCRRYPPAADQADHIITALAMIQEGPVISRDVSPDGRPQLTSVADRLHNYSPEGFFAAWPRTREDEWCGEYSPMPPAPRPARGRRNPAPDCPPRWIPGRGA